MGAEGEKQLSLFFAKIEYNLLKTTQFFIGWSKVLCQSNIIFCFQLSKLSIKNLTLLWN